MSATVEVRTTIGYEPLAWVPIFETSGGNEAQRAIAYAQTIVFEFEQRSKFSKMPPIVRVIVDGKVVPHE